jgi:hypothetical protein
MRQIVDLVPRSSWRERFVDRASHVERLLWRVIASPATIILKPRMVSFNRLYAHQTSR